MASRLLPVRDMESILRQTAPMWEQMRGQRLFLTGCTGFLGCWLLESFLHANHTFSLGASVAVLTRSPERFREKAAHLANDRAVHLVRGDIRTFTFPTGDFQFVIQAATDTSLQAAEQPRILLSSILDGTRRVLDFAATHGTRRLLFASSGAVYGSQPEGVTHIAETYLGGPDWLKPLAAYGEGKRAAELMATLDTHETGVECVIARCFSFVGPYLPLDRHYAIGNFIRDALQGVPIRINGNGTPIRSYLYASDLAVWMWTLLFRAPSGEAYNVGSDVEVSIADVARAVVEALDVALEIRISGEVPPGIVRSRYIPSIKKAREQLGLQVTVGLHDAIRFTSEWHRGTTL
jgi:nucleoside-diphosphate-sugar epimerase